MSPIEIIIAVLHLRKTDFTGINNLGKRILLEGIYVETTLYATPPIDEEDFAKQLQESIDATALAEKGGDKADRKLQAGLLYKMLRRLLNYVNGLYESDEVKLKKSGFDINAIPTPHSVIEQLVIKNIVAGNAPHSVKIIIEKITGDEKTKKETKNFIVRIYADTTTEVCRIVPAGTDSRKLIIQDVAYLVTQYYSITAVNAAGESPASARRKFTLTD